MSLLIGFAFKFNRPIFSRMSMTNSLGSQNVILGFCHLYSHKVEAFEDLLCKSDRKNVVLCKKCLSDPSLS